MKNERGSVTLFVLISMVFFLVIAMTAYVSASSKLQGQNEEVEQIKASYEQDLTRENLADLYNRLTQTREWLPGDGTEQNKYKIYTIEDLVELSNRTNNSERNSEFENKFVELMNDLDFKQDRSYANANRTDFGDINEDGTTQDLKTELTTGQGFMPIGKTNALSFKGTFEGNNYTINHLYIDRNTNLIGLFGNSYTVQNLTVKNGYIRGGTATGGVVGVLRLGKVENCHNDNTTVVLREGNYYYAGGVLGQCSPGTNGITGCTNSGAVFGYSNGMNQNVNGCGGIVGLLSDNALCRLCFNSGTVNGTGVYVGGIAGGTCGVIENCYNTGTITSYDRMLGGIAGGHGSRTAIKLLNNYNKGKIIEKGNDVNDVGGIIGHLSIGGEIKNNYNAGEIEVTGTNPQNIGGVVGRNDIASYFTIENNYYELNKSNVTLNSIGTGLPQSDMITQQFVNQLNASQSDTPWQLDTGINDGYPILKWQLNE